MRFIEGEDMANERVTNRDTQWTVPVSQESENCHNPIRAIEEGQFEDVLTQRRQDLELIKLSIGACH